MAEAGRAMGKADQERECRGECDQRDCIHTQGCHSEAQLCVITDIHCGSKF